LIEKKKKRFGKITTELSERVKEKKKKEGADDPMNEASIAKAEKHHPRRTAEQKRLHFIEKERQDGLAGGESQCGALRGEEDVRRLEPIRKGGPLNDKRKCIKGMQRWRKSSFLYQQERGNGEVIVWSNARSTNYNSMKERGIWDHLNVKEKPHQKKRQEYLRGAAVRKKRLPCLKR